MDSLQTVDVYDEKSERRVNVQELEKYLCPLCKCILADPVQITECGHRCCRDCVKGETLIACPACHVLLKDATPVREDRGCLREMKSLKAKCTVCSVVVELSGIKGHQSMCRDAFTSCDYCQEKIKKDEITAHLDDVCVEYLMSCPWKQNGCMFESKRLEMIHHISTKHSIQQLELLLHLQAQVGVLREKLNGLGIPPGSQNPLSQSQPSAIAASTEVSVPLLGSGKDSEKSVEDLKGRKEDVREASVQDLNIQGLQEGFSKHLYKLESKIDSLSNLVQRHDADIKDLSLKYEILQVKTTNGLFIWKVTDIKRRYKEARDGITYSLFSPPFLTSPHGYRMCLRMYLNGDGEGKGTHVSLFLVLMKGEHDSILPWPFSQKVTLSLINQKDPNLTKKEAFLPDKTSSSFQKPQQEFNVAIGFPKFVPQLLINDIEFCQDDCFFVKAKVELTGMSLD